MNLINIIFKKIIIFDTFEEKAVSMKFMTGINIITSSEINGTDRGKSVLLRSLYHSLGADAFFDSKWNEKSKIYILFFMVDNLEYCIYRSQQFFKIFKNNELLISTSNRTELAEFLGDIFKYKIYLPKKNSESLVIAPPAYSYLFNFLDQDYYVGTKFNSFNKLSQFSNFKLDVIYSHLGIYNQEYFNLIRKKESIERYIKDKKNQENEIEIMKIRAHDILEGFTCPETIKALEDDLKIEVERYSKLLSEMNKIRNKLVSLRNELEEQKITENQLSTYSNNQENVLKKILKTKICPECSTTLSDNINVMSRKYNLIENIITLKDNIKIQIQQTEKEIDSNEKLYFNLTIKLKEIDSKINTRQNKIKDFAKVKGLNILIDELNHDLVKNNIEIKEFEFTLKPIMKEIKKIKKRIKNIDENYSILIDQLKNRFQLNELEKNSYDSMKSSFCASGSNKPLSTVIWYLVLNQLKRNYNKEGTFFPMVFDSPNNAEMDKNKKHALIEYILEESPNFKQLIISAIGFKSEEYIKDKNVNIKLLENNKYELLSKKEYMCNLDLLKRLNDA